MGENRYPHLENTSPTAHSWHAVTPVALEYDPKTQLTQAASCDAPSAAEYFPMPHGSQYASVALPCAMLEVVSSGVVEEVVSSGVVEEVVGCGT